MLKQHHNKENFQISRSIIILFGLLYLIKADDLSLMNSLNKISNDNQAYKIISNAIILQENISDKIFTTVIEKRFWNTARLLIIECFNPKSFDLFPFMLKKKKNIESNQLNHFENITGLLPLNSLSLRK